jgi:hypothetical protein
MASLSRTSSIQRAIASGRLRSGTKKTASLLTLPVPSYMTYTRPFNIYYNAQTKAYSTDFSINWSEVAPFTWYVNGLTGNDANDGLTPATALQKISTAILKTGAGIHRIYVEGGQEYTYDKAWGANVAPSSHTKTYVQARNGRVICSARVVTNGAWTQVGSTEEWTYTKTATPAYSGMVRDAKVKAKDLAAKYYLPFETSGDDTVYSLGTAGSLARGQYAYSGNVMTIRCMDGRDPNSDNLITVELLQNGGKHGFGDIYMTGFDFSGNVPFNLQMTSATQIAAFEDCTFKYGFQTTGATNDLVYLSSGTTIFNRCAAALGKSDNFNFHEKSVGVLSYHFGIDCVSRKAGLEGANNDNCLTGHEQVKGDWINTWCWGSTGPTVNFVDTTEIGLYGGGADGCTATSSNDFSVGTTGTGKMLLHGYDAGIVESGNRTNVGTGASLYYFDTEITPSLGTAPTAYRIPANVYGEVA